MKALDRSTIEQYLTENLSEWEWSGDKLHRSFTFPNFRKAVSFITEVAFEAEEHGHHPEIFNLYNRVKLSLTTHDADNRVTDKDIELARAIEEIYRTN